MFETAVEQQCRFDVRVNTVLMVAMMWLYDELMLIRWWVDAGVFCV